MVNICFLFVSYWPQWIWGVFTTENGTPMSLYKVMFLTASNYGFRQYRVSIVRFRERVWIDGWRSGWLPTAYKEWCPEDVSSLSPKILPVKTASSTRNSLWGRSLIFFYRLPVTGAQTPRDISSVLLWCNQFMQSRLLSWEKAIRMTWRSRNGVPGGMLWTVLGDRLSNKMGQIYFTLWLKLDSAVES